MKWRSPLEYGLNEDDDVDHRRHVIFANLVYVSIGSIMLINVILFYGIPGGLRPISRLTPLIIVGISAICYVLSVSGWHLTSRSLFLICWFSFVNILPIVEVGPTVNAYFTNVFYIILFSPVIHLFFSNRSERPYLIFFLSASFLLTFFYIDFLFAFDRSPEPKVPYVTSIESMRIIHVTAWIFLNILMIYVLRVNRKFFGEINLQKEIIDDQKKLLQQSNRELAYSNSELMLANEELIALNEKVNALNRELEKRVTDRTRELSHRNEKLTEYAFMNAHLLRSPVSRIKGLINLFLMIKDPMEKEKVHTLLSETAEELDQVIHAMSEKLNKA